MGVDRAIDITAKQRKIVTDLLERHLPNTTAWVYGSRAKWASRPQSDLDLVVFATPEQNGRVSDLREALEESNLPFRVDLFVWDAVPEQFHKQIKSEHVVLVESGERDVVGEWPAALWGELATLEYGKSLRGYDSSEGPYRVYGTNGPIGWHSETLCSHPGVIIGRKGAYRGVHYSASPFFVIDTAFYLKPNAEIDTRWAYYELLTQDINGMDSGSAIPSTSREDFYGLPVQVPPLPEQRAIAHILGTLDDKIELNRRINETLEAMARALFKSWFVDFDPVRAKMAGRDTGLPKHLADLFPDRLVESELGEIPEGWGVKALGDLCHKPQYGYTSSARDRPIGPKFLRIMDINKRPWIDWVSVPYCEITVDNPNKYRIYKSDILIARMADPGHGIMVEEDQDAVFASYLIRFRPIDKRHARILQYWIRSDGYWDLVRGRSAGTTRVSLNAKDLSGFPLVVPSESLTSKFSKHVSRIRASVVANAAEMQTLTSLRDTLLPKLIAGELRVEGVNGHC